MRLSQSQLCKLISFTLILGWTCQTQARVFSFASESLAPYVGIRAGLPTMGTEPYRWQSAGAYSGDKVEMLYGGEFGIYLRGSSVGMAVGILVDTFNAVEGGHGGISSGQILYDVDVKGIAWGPSLNFDYQFASSQSILWKLIVGGGYKFAKIQNTYSLTAAGQSLSGGQSAFSESYIMESPFATLGFATEFFLSGSTTMSVFAGYHLSFNNEWKYKDGGQNFAGIHEEGATVHFEDGSAKLIHWSYPFVQIGFQFYVDSLR